LNAPDNVLRMWTVYARPADYPLGFIARLFEVDGSGGVRATHQAVTGATLEAVRARLPGGLHRLARNPQDHFTVVESWL
jgi:hypothetical protein